MDPYMLVVLLNSRFVNWWLHRIAFNQACRTMHFDTPYSALIPLPEKLSPIRRAAEIARRLAKKSASGDFEDACEEIDGLVFEAYDIPIRAADRIRKDTWPKEDWRCGVGEAS